MNRLNKVLNYLYHMHLDVNSREVVLWADTVLHNTMELVYMGSLHHLTALTILQCTYEEFDAHMKRMYGPGWEETYRLNYSIDRNGD